MGAKRKRTLFTKREEKQTQWVVGWQTNGTQRKRGCYSVGEKRRHSGWLGWQVNAGGREKEDAIWKDKEQTWSSWGEAPKESESLNQILSQSLTENVKKCFTCLLSVWCLQSLQSRRTKDWYSQSLIVNHFLKGFTGLFFSVLCWTPVREVYHCR